MPPKKKKPGRRPGKKKSLLLPAGIVLLLLASLGAAFYFVFLRTEPPSLPEISAGPAKKAPRHDLAFPPPLPAPLADPFAMDKAPPPMALPRVAIVIDDMGIQQATGEQLLALDLDLTFAFLPYGPHTQAMARTAGQLGRDILLHLPLEPDNTERWDPGPGALYRAMPPAAMQLHLEKDLSLVPQAIGVNNHMGSKFTADRTAMRTVLALLRPRDLFFLDSLTTAASVAYETATAMGIPARRRDVFLDNVQEQAAIEGQLDALIRVARQQGAAVAIGHPYPTTVAAIAAYRQRLCTEVHVVGLHRLMSK